MRQLDQGMEIGGVALRSRLWCGPARFVGLSAKRRERALQEAAQGMTGAILLRVALHGQARSEPCEPDLSSASARQELTALLAASRRRGSELIVELSHGGPRCADWSPQRALGFEDRPDPISGRRPRVPGPDEIDELLMDFERGAQQAADLGGRILALDLAGGSLLHQLMSATHRGTFADADDLLRKIVSRVGAARPTVLHMALEDLEVGGLTPSAGVELALKLEPLGVAAFVITAGSRGRAHLERALKPPRQLREGRHARLAGWLAERSSTPVGLCGGLRSRAAMDRILDEHGLDFVVLERPFAADPDLGVKLQSAGAVSRCTSQRDCLATGGAGVVDNL